MTTPIVELTKDHHTTIFGWLRSARLAAKNSLLFGDLDDGTGVVQIVLKKADDVDLTEVANVGTGLIVEGELTEAPAKATQDFEFVVSKIRRVGACPSDTYPLPKAGAPPMTLENLRKIPHLRLRDQRLALTQRIRSALTLATHEFFQSRHFLQAHTPIITASDCEGAGEMFKLEDKEFFGGKEVYLTVSGQLEGEKMAIGGGLGRIYTFGPTFRAEDSHTSRHLAEFWMIEPEWVGESIDELCLMAEAYVRHCATHVAGIDKDLVAILDRPFRRITYSEAIKLLQKKDPTTEWGIDLSSDQEQWLCGDTPLIITHYPEAIKSFYMKRDPSDPRTVQAMDVLVPGIGELIGGSVREDDLTILEPKAKGNETYLDTRRFGSLPHMGFGLGFERLVRLLAQVDNIRDVIPFPRMAGKVAE